MVSLQQQHPIDFTRYICINSSYRLDFVFADGTTMKIPIGHSLHVLQNLPMTSEFVPER